MNLRCPQCAYVAPEPTGQVATLVHCPKCRRTMAPGSDSFFGKLRSEARTQVRMGLQDMTMVGSRSGLPLSALDTDALQNTEQNTSVEMITPHSGPDLSCISSDSEPKPLPIAADQVPGFRIEGVIGHGGMGSVYKARQLSLDRIVALKVMNQVWASDPVFVARFVREAYAAAALNHPNVVQIYDIGEASGYRYFSMEYVEGRSIGDIIKSQGKIGPEPAVEYILQAARGLKHAHDRGIIHRDIKPDNLLIDEHGTVKVADLGLVKTPDMTRSQDSLSTRDYGSDSGLHNIPSNMTGVRMALGTPAYMAPEQCRDAASVDHRADIYSLGCTLYIMLTGRQPFEADSTVALMKKQAYEALTPPEEINPRVPKELSQIVQKMMAKLPGDRFAKMDDVIRAFEYWLGIQSTAGRFVPREEQIAEVERLAHGFRTIPSAIAHQRLTSGFVSVCALGALLMLFFGKIGWAFGLAGMVVQATVAYFAIREWSQKSPLYKRIQQFIRGMSIGDWIVAIAGVGAVVALLAMSKLLLIWLGFGMLGVAAAGGLWIFVDRKLAIERRPVLESAHEYIRTLRRQSVSKDEIHQFFARNSGREWEEIFEAVFDYPSKIAMRGVLSRGANATREKYGAWREPLISILNRIETSRKKARERAMIEQTEFERLLAGGMPKRLARIRSRRSAEAIIDNVNAQIPAKLAVNSSAFVPGIEEQGEDRLARVASWFVGVHVRVVLAAILLALCGIWMAQNDLFFANSSRMTEPLEIAGLPTQWTNWCDTINVGWGGMLLIGSLFYRGQRMAALSILGAGITVLGHKFGIRTVEPVQDYHVALFLGTVLALVAYRIGRR